MALNENLKTLQHQHAELKARLAAVSPPDRLRRLEIFLPDYVEAIQDVKRIFTPKTPPQEILAEIESIGKTILAEVKFYFKEVNKNHTVQMADVLRQLYIIVNGLPLSDSFLQEIDGQSQSNHWHGH